MYTRDLLFLNIIHLEIYQKFSCFGLLKMKGFDFMSLEAAILFAAGEAKCLRSL